MKTKIKLVQQILKSKNLYDGTIDGLYGPNTEAGLNQIEGLSKTWSIKKKITGAIQIFAEENGIDCQPIDGLWGPVTEEAYNALTALIKEDQKPSAWRPEDLIEVNPHDWPKQYTEAFDEFYGEQGDHQTKVDLPYPHKLSWQTSKVIHRFSCHEKVKESIEKVLNNVLDYYGLDEIQRLKLDYWGGCFNIRPIRGGSKPSMHSWGIAIDYDPIRNKLRWGRDRASFAKPDYDKWWEFWEEEGWVSLGRQRNFDWMHIQAAKI